MEGKYIAAAIGTAVAAEATGVTNFSGGGGPRVIPMPSQQQGGGGISGGQLAQILSATKDKAEGTAKSGMDSAALAAMMSQAKQAPTVIQTGGGKGANQVEEIIDSLPDYPDPDGNGQGNPPDRGDSGGGGGGGGGDPTGQNGAPGSYSNQTMLDKAERLVGGTEDVARKVGQFDAEKDTPHVKKADDGETVLSAPYEAGKATGAAIDDLGRMGHQAGQKVNDVIPGTPASAGSGDIVKDWKEGLGL